MKRKMMLLTLVVIAVLGLSICCSFALTETSTASLADCNISATNNVELTSGYDSIGVSNPSASKGLDATYTSLNPNTMVFDTQRQYGSGQWGVIVRFNAPTNYRTVKIVTDFSAAYLGQSWNMTMTTVR